MSASTMEHRQNYNYRRSTRAGFAVSQLCFSGATISRLVKYEYSAGFSRKHTYSVCIFFIAITNAPAFWAARGLKSQGFLPSPPGACLRFLSRIGFTLPKVADYHRMSRTHALAFSSTEEDNNRQRKVHFPPGPGFDPPNFLTPSTGML